MTSTESADLDRLVEAYPHLEEKAIVDFINGFSVMSDHLDVKCKIANKGPSARLFDKLTGRSAKRQELIDRSVESSFVFIKEYVVSNEKRLAKNEHFLHQIMSGVSMISAKLQEVAGDTVTLRKNLNELADKVDGMEQSLSQRLDYYDLYNSAMAELKLALSVFAMEDPLFKPEQSLWMLLTRLKYGDFGLWLESSEGGSKHDKTVQAVMQALKNDCLRILAKLTGRSTHELVDRKALFTRLSTDDELLQDALCLVSGRDSNALESLILTINSGNVPSPDAELPYVFSSASIYQQMSCVFESGERHAASY
ncbi:MAG: hypothetical protein V7772_07835 [Pseudomonas profundi]|uniref:hypothetical protein n=1 Tax=Pseudomonas profundi TaxID=1981513 RepID=UPI0030037FA5